MINANIVGISDYYIYRNENNCNLSKFLLEIYFSQLDIYIKKFSTCFNISKLLCLKPYFLRFFYKQNLTINKKYLPIKIRRRLLNCFNFKNLIHLKSKNNLELYNKNFYQISFLYFFRHVYYVRCVENIALGVVGSKNFAKFVNKKFQSFLRSNLHLDFFSSNLYDSFSEKIFFLGFHVQIFISAVRSYSCNSNFKISKKYFSRIYSRLVFWKKKISFLTSYRFNTELFGQIISIMHCNNLNFSFKTDRKVWLFLFQLEAIRCFQVGKLINSFDKLNIISNENLQTLKFVNVNSYKNFYFNFYFKKIRLLINNVINSFPSFRSYSVLPFDMMLLNFFDEYKKKFHFFNDIFYCGENYLKFQVESRLINNKTAFLQNRPVQEKIVLLQKIFSSQVKNKLKLNSYFLVNCPISYMLLKFANLGFLNLKKKRPISNLKFLSYEDEEIVSFFGAFSYSLLNWFRCADNFSKVKILVELIRQSCFLTICRKHNKRKTWVYSVYTTNLVFNHKLQSDVSFFPTKKSVFNMQKSFLNDDINFLCCENFFKNLKSLIYKLRLNILSVKKL